MKSKRHVKFPLKKNVKFREIPYNLLFKIGKISGNCSMAGLSKLLFGQSMQGKG